MHGVAVRSGCRNRPWQLISRLHSACYSTSVPSADQTNAKTMKIYTKTGDKGLSSLYNGARLPKDDAYFHALGDVDELNAAIGISRENCQDNANIAQQLEVLQCRLLDLGSAIATPVDASSEAKRQRVQFDPLATMRLEEWIDTMDSELPPLTNFILPSGGPAASFLHLSRTVGIFLNRLSDYLFTAARYVAMKAGNEEVIYKKQS